MLVCCMINVLHAAAYLMMNMLMMSTPAVMMNLPELFMFAFGLLFMISLHEEPYNTMLCWLNEEH